MDQGAHNRLPFTIAVAGCGWVSSACHGPAYRRYAQRNPGVALLAACDIDLDRVQEFCSEFGFERAYSNYLEMLERERPTVVCLNVPEVLTCEMGVNILAAGYPLLAEKPPGISAEEIDRLVAAAAQKRIPNMAAFNRRYMPLMVALKKHLAGCEMQHIHYNLARIGRSGGDFSPTAIHAIDAVRFLAGAGYAQIHFHYQELPHLGKDVANTHLDCRFANDVTASIDINPLSGINVERAVVHGYNHTFLLNCNNGPDAPGSLLHYEKGRLILELDGAELSQTDEDFVLNGFYAEDAAFFDAVRTGAPIADDIQSARQSVEIMQWMRERRPEYNSRGS
jgi:myo-inositol 2-dehydrogenase / D-chiro-inositol 1-dehydrogenase